ncbi:MAG: MFS transporter [Nitrospinaceae bacterium]
MQENSSLLDADVTLKTYRYDLWRGGFEGVLSTGAQTFCLFIAIRYYHAGETVKSLIASAPFMGMFLSLILVHHAEGSRWRKSLWGALPATVTGLCLLLAAWVPFAEGFAFFVIVGYICRSALLPFLTDIYGDNYPPRQRGTYFSRSLILTVGVSAGFGFVGSSLLQLDLGHFHWLFTFLGLCGLGKAYAIYSMPSSPIEGNLHTNPFANLKYVIRDRSFGYVLVTWFIMGFANLWTLPLRVEYVTSSTYGIEGSAVLVALIITVIPDTMRMLFIPFWAKLFDTMNFVVLRMVLNILFAAGVGSFFITGNPWVIGMGAALIGFSFAGGSIAWNLWVTKYAPPGKTAAYMSVHVFLTGIRGTLGPLIGYWAIDQIGPVNIGLLSAGMMVLATVMLIPEIQLGKRGSAREPV